SDVAGSHARSYGAREAPDAERDLVGGVPGHPVLSTGEDLELRPPDRRVQTLGVGEREVLVPLAPEDQRRAADARVERGEPRQRSLVAAAHEIGRASCRERG